MAISRNYTHKTRTILTDLQNVINWFDLSLDDAISWASDNPRKILGNFSSEKEFSNQWINWKKMEGMWKVMEVQTGKFKIQNYS